MKRSSVSVYTDIELWEQAEKNGIDRSAVIEKALKAELEKNVTLDQLCEREANLINQLEEVQKLKAPFMEAELKKSADEAKEREAKIKKEEERAVTLHAIYDGVPEVMSITEEQIRNTTYMTAWLIRMKERYGKWFKYSEVIEFLRIVKPEVSAKLPEPLP